MQRCTFIHTVSVCSQVCHPAASQPGAERTLETPADEVADRKPLNWTRHRGREFVERAFCHGHTEESQSRLCQWTFPLSSELLPIFHRSFSSCIFSLSANLLTSILLHFPSAGSFYVIKCILHKPPPTHTHTERYLCCITFVWTNGSVILFGPVSRCKWFVYHIPSMSRNLVRCRWCDYTLFITLHNTLSFHP